MHQIRLFYHNKAAESLFFLPIYFKLLLESRHSGGIILDYELEHTS